MQAFSVAKIIGAKEKETPQHANEFSPLSTDWYRQLTQVIKCKCYGLFQNKLQITLTQFSYRSGRLFAAYSTFPCMEVLKGVALLFCV